MFSLRQTLSATLAATTLLSSGAALADPCDSLITTEMNWVRDTPSGYSRSIIVTTTSLNGAAQASYTVADLSKYSPASCLWLNGICYPLPASLSSYSSDSQYFNKDCVTTPGDYFPVCVNPFSDGSDTAKLTLTSTYLSINPDEAGLATTTISNLTCQNGVMYGFSSNSAPSLYVIDLARSEYVIPK